MNANLTILHRLRNWLVAHPFIAVALAACLLCQAIYLPDLIIFGPVTWIQQRQLAALLGVDISDYQVFPTDYFRQVLRPDQTPGASLEEVHKTVVGYKRVMKCVYGEIYFFYTSTERTAFQIQFWYDEEQRLTNIIDDINSGGVNADDSCVPGRLGE